MPVGDKRFDRFGVSLVEEHTLIFRVFVERNEDLFGDRVYDLLAAVAEVGKLYLLAGLRIEGRAADLQRARRSERGSVNDAQGNDRTVVAL